MGETEAAEREISEWEREGGETEFLHERARVHAHAHALAACRLTARRTRAQEARLAMFNYRIKFKGLKFPSPDPTFPAKDFLLRITVWAEDGLGIQARSRSHRHALGAPRPTHAAPLA